MKRSSRLFNIRRSSPKDAWQPNRRRNRGKDGSPPKEKKGKTDPPEDGPKKSRKILIGALRVIASMVLTVATLWAGFAAYRHATTSDYFSVTDFHVKGVRRLNEEEVLAAAGVEKGTNIFRVDCSVAKAKLEDHPWVLTAEVRRRLPRNVDVDVTERLAVATVIFDVPYLVDDEGVVFKRWVLGDPTPSPILTGFTRAQFAGDTNQVQETIRDAISLAKRYRASGLDKNAPLAEIHHEVDGAFSLAVGGDPIYVRFGKGPYRAKLRRLATLLGQLRSEGRRPSMIYFDNEVRPDRATVRLKPNETETPTKEGRKNPDSQNSLQNMQKRMSKI